MHAHMHCTTKPIQRGWEPDYLVRWLFDQTDIWITTAGNVVQVTDMDPEDALNTLCFLERVADDFPFGRDLLQSKPLYEAIRKRVLDILVPPPPRLYEAGPAEAQWQNATRNFVPIPGEVWAVYKLTDDGRFEWDAPFSKDDAERLADLRNDGFKGTLEAAR